MKVSLVVSIYNTAQYIEQCVRSLAEQTLEDIEIVLVNDATQDESMAIVEKTLADYPQRRHQVQIVNHERNLGLGKTRRDGFAVSKGDYVIFVDSDDFADTRMAELLYNKAVDSSADLVICGFYRYNGTKRVPDTIVPQGSTETGDNIREDIIKYVIAPDYWVGLRVVPIVMAAEIMMGIYFNLSFWYKLEDKTYWGAIFSTIGCSVIIVGNLLFVPRFGYIACAWAGFAGYLTSMLLSYIVGFIYHPISYPRRSMSVYVLMSILFYALMHYGRQLLPQWASMSMNTVLIMLFVAHLLYYDLPVSQLPVIGNLIKRRK